MLATRVIGRFLKKKVLSNRQPHVIFCPGMGGNGHSATAYAIWQEFKVWFASWTDFADGGQAYMEYEDTAKPKDHPGGSPHLKPEKVRALKEMIRSSSDPVILLGFSAGAYLCMKTALELESEGG